MAPGVTAGAATASTGRAAPWPAVAHAAAASSDPANATPAGSGGGAALPGEGNAPRLPGAGPPPPPPAPPPRAGARQQPLDRRHRGLGRLLAVGAHAQHQVVRPQLLGV